MEARIRDIEATLKNYELIDENDTNSNGSSASLLRLKGRDDGYRYDT